MKIARAKFVYVFLLAIFFFVACRENANQNVNRQTANSIEQNASTGENSNLPKDDVAELERTIKLPFHPEEAIWLTAANEKKLVAVLKFSSEEANQIVQQAERYKPATQAAIDAENWFPAELIAQSQLSGDETLKGNSYSANDFLQPPFSNGKITRIAETNFFVLELTVG